MEQDKLENRASLMGASAATLWSMIKRKTLLWLTSKGDAEFIFIEMKVKLRA